MPQCITANTALEVTTLEVDAAYPVRINGAVPTIKITFDPPVTRDATGAIVSSGTVTGVSVSPSGPDFGTDWVEFTTDDVGTTFDVMVTYTDPPRIDSVAPPLETPTKTPKFKPQTTCPTGAQ